MSQKHSLTQLANFVSQPLTPDRGPFRANLSAQGWVEGKNLIIDYRWGANVVDVAAQYTQEIIDLMPNVVLATGFAVAALAKATKTIPIVFANVAQPLETGLVDSLAHPSGNVNRVCDPRLFPGRTIS